MKESCNSSITDVLLCTDVLLSFSPRASHFQPESESRQFFVPIWGITLWLFDTHWAHRSSDETHNCVTMDTNAVTILLAIVHIPYLRQEQY